MCGSLCRTLSSNGTRTSKNTLERVSEKYRMEIFTLAFVGGFTGVFFSGGSLNLPLRLVMPTEIDSSGGMSE